MIDRVDVDPQARRTGVVAILRGGTGEHVAAVAEALIGAGVRCIEITANTAGAAEALADLHRTHGDAVSLGYGTVRSVSDVQLAASLGARFVVAPNTSPEVGAAAAAHRLGWYPGAFTPTEIERAWSLGASAVKVFPASLAGGPEYLRAVRAPLDDIPLLPTGGVEIETIGAYLDAGAVAVGLGSPLIGDALRTGDVQPLGLRARAALDAAAAPASRA